MNQILITGDEKIAKKIKKQKNVVPINGIVIFYAICTIILGICILCGSIYTKEKIKQTIEANIKPEISVERDDEDNTIKITVTHIRGIKTVVYRWNDEEETTIDGKNRKEISETIDLIGGENTLKISVTEENGETKNIEKTFVAGNIPEIEIVEAIENGVKVQARSDDGIEYLQYSWDDGEMQKVEVGEKEYEGIINAPKGQHTLKIEVIDINGIQAKIERTIIGDTEPTVNVESKLLNGKATFVLDIEDDEEIETIEITHNSGEKQIIEVNDKTYHKEIVMTEGEVNTILVKAINLNGLAKTRGIKFNNK